jgi:hypothetical protein
MSRFYLKRRFGESNLSPLLGKKPAPLGNTDRAGPVLRTEVRADLALYLRAETELSEHRILNKIRNMNKVQKINHFV